MKTSIIWGLIIIMIGFALLLNNLGITDLNIGDIIATYWPLIFVLWGLDTIIDRRNKSNNSNLIFGSILLFLGIALIGRNLDYYYFNISILWKSFWPLLLIFIGVNIIRSGAFTEKSSVAIMSGIEKKNNNWELSNKSYFALMGGIDLDLHKASIPEGETRLELTAIMGGIDIKAPKDINIICENTSILGGINFFDDDSGGIIMNKDFKHESAGSNKTIYIKSTCIMGGIDIK
ncbi:MAG: LiaF transmembrane domain-containing protein [Bacillota bacterium]